MTTIKANNKTTTYIRTEDLYKVEILKELKIIKQQNKQILELINQLLNP